MDKKLDGRTESYRAATMYRIGPNEESIPVETTTSTTNVKDSPEVIRTRCCGLCSKKKSKNNNSPKETTKPFTSSNNPVQAAVALNK